jgi:hypothetical protein
MSDNVFVDDHILMDVGLDSAGRQLERLARDGVLLSASEYAYGAGITGLAETAGLAAGMSRLVGVRPGDLTETEGCARLWLRWEATGSDGTLFPALDADLTLSPAGENTTVLTLAGVYRLPEHAGTGLDPGIVRCFAAVTIDSFIARLACALMHPAGSAIPAGLPGQNSPCHGPDGRPHDGPDTRVEGSAIHGGEATLADTPPPASCPDPWHAASGLQGPCPQPGHAVPVPGMAEPATSLMTRSLMPCRWLVRVVLP